MSAEDEAPPERAPEENDAIAAAIVALVPPLLQALEALGFVGRHLHPPQLGRLLAAVGRRDDPVRAALEPFRKLDWPAPLDRFRELVESACDSALQAFDGLRAAAEGGDGAMQAYRALRFVSRALEALYPAASMLPSVSQFYLEAPARNDRALLQRLAETDPDRENVGVMHVDNERGMRGGFSLYVPEYYDAARAHPLIVALHGGSGHGRAFLWSWMREARPRQDEMSPLSGPDTTSSTMRGDSIR